MQLEKIQNSAPKVPELVMQALVSAIESGQIKVGEEIPSERDMAERLGVGRGSLRECMAILEFLGAIESNGNRKRLMRDSDYIRKAQSFVKISNRLDSMDDFLEFRRATEVEIAALACKRATDEDIGAIYRALEKLERNINDGSADVEFHDALAVASHNMMMVAAVHLINSMIASIHTRFVFKPDFSRRSRESHRAIYEAVKARDEQLARREMNIHLDIVKELAHRYPND